MPQKLIQTQKEEQTQQLSAVQVAMARLLELPVMDLEQRVRNELEDNAALEEVGPDKDEEDMAAETTEADDNESETAEDEPHADDETADYLTEDDIICCDNVTRPRSARGNWRRQTMRMMSFIDRSVSTISMNSNAELWNILSAVWIMMAICVKICAPLAMNWLFIRIWTCLRKNWSDCCTSYSDLNRAASEHVTCRNAFACNWKVRSSRVLLRRSP